MVKKLKKKIFCNHFNQLQMYVIPLVSLGVVATVVGAAVDGTVVAVVVSIEVVVEDVVVVAVG